MTELHTKPFVRLLASRSNVVVAFAKVVDFAATAPPSTKNSVSKNASRQLDGALVKIEAVIDG